MCGIAGVFGKAQEDDVRLMIRSIRHRGPDAEGYQNNDCGWLGHCRLSIIDIAGGIQPMSNEDSHVLLAFNGEIYNYNELRQELSELGVTFHTKSDTEVILRGYVYWGEEIVKRLDGMFAFAILDAKKEILLLARDRIGKKPLYWNIDNNTVTFCSELKGIHANPNVHSTVNIDSLRQYFLFDAVQTPNSIVQNIFKVQPATYIIFQTNGNKKEMTYWTPPSIITEPKSFNSIQEELDKRLQKAVQTRLLLADVPVGVFLSGGIDSATIAWYAQQELKNIETFSIGFKEKSYDESADARIVSTALGTRHHEFFVSAKESCDVISKLGELVDEPIADRKSVV